MCPKDVFRLNTTVTTFLTIFYQKKDSYHLNMLIVICHQSTFFMKEMFLGLKKHVFFSKKVIFYHKSLFYQMSMRIY